MDAYGAIEPVDIPAMENVFKQLQADSGVQIQGNHYASMINAYGCVQKNLDEAVKVFNSIPSHLKTRLADAVVFESMINALVANRRTDLIPSYVEKMKQTGVHMTAYIANFLIKGYALAGDIEQARQIFESLEDPPQGVAAPNNHAPHDSSESPVVDSFAPVYREVSNAYFLNALN
jgi:pentatricopeptide repeat protein